MFPAHLTRFTRSWQSSLHRTHTPRSSLNRARRRAPPLLRRQNFASHSGLHREAISE